MSKHSKDSDLIIYPETVIPELYDDKDKLKNTCVAFGCGYAPHDGAPVVRGAEY